MKTLIALLILGLTYVGWARFIESWDYEKLAAEADLVLIGSPDDVDDTDKSEAIPKVFIGGSEDSKPAIAAVTLTRFAVQAVLKGELAEEKFILRHLRIPEERYSEREELMIFHVNGPSFVSFDVKSNGCYLMFLKRLPSGQYVSVTGQTHPKFGIKRLDGYPVRKKPKAEQGVAQQSATRSESDSEGGDKSQSESEEHSR